MNAEDLDYFDTVARRVYSRAYTWEWAIHLVARRLGFPDAWTPVVALSDALRRVR